MVAIRLSFIFSYCPSLSIPLTTVCARARTRATGSGRMAAASQSVASFCSGLVHRSSHAKLPFGIRQCNGAKIDNCNYVSVTSRRIVRGGRGIQYLTARRVGTICAASVGGDHRQLRIDDDSPQEPYILSLVKEAVWGLRSLFVFLVEQPSQLKYIEWPGFRSTLKTATLTLVLVALLIVALSSTDSALSYLLALILKRTP